MPQVRRRIRRGCLALIVGLARAARRSLLAWRGDHRPARARQHDPPPRPHGGDRGRADDRPRPRLASSRSSRPGPRPRSTGDRRVLRRQPDHREHLHRPATSGIPAGIPAALAGFPAIAADHADRVHRGPREGARRARSRSPRSTRPASRTSTGSTGTRVERDARERSGTTGTVLDEDVRRRAPPTRRARSDGADAVGTADPAARARDRHRQRPAARRPDDHAAARAQRLLAAHRRASTSSATRPGRRDAQVQPAVNRLLDARFPQAHSQTATQFKARSRRRSTACSRSSTCCSRCR